MLVTTSADILRGRCCPPGAPIYRWCDKFSTGVWPAERASARNVAVGDTLESSVNARSAWRRSRLSVRRDITATRTAERSRRLFNLELRRHANQRHLHHRIQPTASSAAAICGKPDNCQSDLTLDIARHELQNDVFPGIQIDYRTAWQAGGAWRGASESSAGQLSVDLLYAVAGLLLLETVIAWLAWDVTER